MDETDKIAGIQQDVNTKEKYLKNQGSGRHSKRCENLRKLVDKQHQVSEGEILWPH